MDPIATKKSHAILFLNTLAFTVCFAAWMINGVLVTFLVDHGVYKWSPVQIGWLLGVPVLVGAIFRLPVGMLTDRIGGRWVMGGVMLLSAVPMFFLSHADNFESFLLLSFGFGLAGTSFASGVAYTCMWYPKERQGTALGIFGAGNLGASLTTLFAPTLLMHLTSNATDLDSWRQLPRWYAVALVVMAAIFLLATENRKPAAVKTMSERLAPLKEVRVWRFGLYYYFVFGSFVALSQWLVPYYVNVYSMSIVAAGFMATAFSLPAGLVRALGGWLADRAGARQVLYWVFGGSAICLVFLFVPRMEIKAPGQGIMAMQAGTVTSVSYREIMIDDVRYAVQTKHDTTSMVMIRYGIHENEEGFLPLPTALFWQEPLVRVGDTVSKGQLVAKGVTEIYFQANKWIFSCLVLVIGLAMGIGAAAVYKHVSDYYPQSVGTVGGNRRCTGRTGRLFGSHPFWCFTETKRYMDNVFHAPVRPCVDLHYPSALGRKGFADPPQAKQRPLTSWETMVRALANILETIRHLTPAYFAMVMATGIVSIASQLQGMPAIAWGLFWLNIAAYTVLWILTGLRSIRFREYVLRDLFDHARCAGFFTTVAATCVLGMQFILLLGNYRAAAILWLIGLLLWLVLTYSIFTALTIKEDKPSLSEGINGSWLLAVVATQSLAVLSSKLSMHFVAYKLIINFFAFSMWLWGGMQYIWMISLIFYRYTFFKFSPGDLSPPYWINMGAMAISTLAGALLIINTPDAPYLLSTLPFLKGFTVFYWATGTWWIPMLAILAVWRHVYKRFPLTYDPLYWGAVFPLGMYTACTYEMAEAMHLDFLLPVPRYFIYVALLAWGATFVGLVRSVIRGLFAEQLSDASILSKGAGQGRIMT